MLSFLYCFLVKSKLIWAQSLPPVEIESATQVYCTKASEVKDPWIDTEGISTVR